MPDTDHPPLDHLGELERVAADLAAVFDAVDPAAAVPGCPGWTVADLALHIGSGQRWAASVLLSGRAQQLPEVLRPVGSWADWYAGTTAALVAAIRAVDPDEPCWNFAPVEQRAAFWSRRRLHETVVHLADAHQAAAESGTPIPPAASDTGGTASASGTAVSAASGSAGESVAPVSAVVAADGVDEVFGVFLPRMLARGFAPAVTRRIGVRAVDTGDEWTLSPAGIGEPPLVERGRADGEAVVSGTASDLLLCLWKRLPADRLTVTGDPEVAAGFLAGRATP